MPRKSTARLWKNAKNPNQKYRDRITITLPDGTSREVVGYGATKKAATDALYVKVDKFLGMESPKVRSQYTFGQMMEEFLERERLTKGWAMATQFNYRRFYATYLEPYLADKALIDVTADDIRLTLNQALEKGYFATAEQVQGLLKRALYWLQKAYPELSESMALQINHLPKIRAAKENSKPTPAIWTEEQVVMFLDCMAEIYKQRTYYAAYPFFSVALMAGLRTGEIFGLERSNLVLKDVGKQQTWYLQVRQQYVTIKGQSYRGAPKSRSGIRDVPIPETLATILKNHMHHVDMNYPKTMVTNLIIPTRLGTQQHLTYMRVKKNEVIDSLGLPPVHTHHMRKIFATHLTKKLNREGKYNPKIVAKILGHANTKVALEVYTQIIEEDVGTAFIDYAITSKKVG